MYTYRYPRPAVAVDIVLLRGSGPDVQILLVRRSQQPFQGVLALPGGFVGPGESLEEAAKRELREETGFNAEHLVQIQTFSAPDRDPRGWVISTAFGELIDGSAGNDITAGSDASRALWIDLKDLPPLAFDHRSILTAALEKFAPDLPPVK